MIGVIAHLKVADGKQEELEAIAKDLAAKVKANEPGCLVYSLGKKKGSETEYYFMEQYRDQDAVDAHRASAHFQEASPKLGACLAAKPDIIILNSVE